MEIVIHSMTRIDVRSETYAKLWYRVNAEEGTCQCRGFQHRGGCKHLKEVAKRLRSKGMLHNIATPERETETPSMPEVLPTVYTSRFFAEDLLTSNAVIPVRISMFPPIVPLHYKVIDGPRSLMPSKRMIGEWNRFSPEYFNRLESYGIELIATQLVKLAAEHGDKALALLCYEDLLRGHKCHRHLFGVWWEEQTGQVLPELTNDGELIHPLELHKQNLPIRKRG